LHNPQTPKLTYRKKLSILHQLSNSEEVYNTPIKTYFLACNSKTQNLKIFPPISPYLLRKNFAFSHGNLGAQNKIVTNLRPANLQIRRIASGLRALWLPGQLYEDVSESRGSISH
jgi:hypothetical protein